MTQGGVIRARCEVLSSRRTGAYHSLTLVAPAIAEQSRPGQFVEVAVPEGRDFMLRRPFSIHQASRRGGWVGTLEIVLEAGGPGTAWLADRRAHDTLDVIGPLGRPFQYPRQKASCLLVAGGYGAAPLYFLAGELRARDHNVSMIVGAREHARVFKPVEGKRLASAITITTDDGTMGARGRVTDVLPDAVARTRAQVVYACGPNPMLRAVSDYCTSKRIPCQVAVEELMACGMGVCWTCVVPVISPDRQTWWNLRACMEGPVFNGAHVWWDRWLGREQRAAGVEAVAPTPLEPEPVEAQRR